MTTALENQARMTLALLALAQHVASRHYRNDNARRVKGARPCAICKTPQPSGSVVNPYRRTTP